MMRLHIVTLVIIITYFRSYSQDTIQLHDDNQSYAYKFSKGFLYCVDENQHAISFKKGIPNRRYTLLYDNHVVGKVNKISDKEFLIFYINSDSVVDAIEYQPYFKIRLKLVGDVYSISSINTWEKPIEISFDLKKNGFHIAIIDRKNKKSIEVNNMEILSSKKID